MLNLLLEASSGNWFTKYGVLIIIAVLLVLFMVFTYTRRKKEDGYYQELNSQIKPGANVKTRSGIYGKVISITETTDGKIVLLETGEGSHISYQNIHMDAIFALDTKQPVVYDADGGRILPEEMKDKETKEIAAPLIAPISKTENKTTPAETKKAEKKPATKANVTTVKPVETKTAPAKVETKNTKTAEIKTGTKTSSQTTKPKTESTKKTTTK